MEVSRGNEYDQLQKNINKLELLARSLKFKFENGTDTIKEYCDEQIRLIQLSTENKIEQIYKLNNNLIKLIREYETKCIQSYLNKTDLITESTINKMIQDVESFLHEKRTYLKQFKTNEDEIKIFNKISADLESSLKKEAKKLQSLTFDNELIKFKSNNNEIDESELGYISYERLIKSSLVFILNFYFI